MSSTVIQFKKNLPFTVNLKAMTALTWKTYDSQLIPFLKDEDLEHVRLIRESLPLRLTYLKGFFSKKAFTELPSSRLGYDVIFELFKSLKGKLTFYRISLSFLLLEKEIISELLRISFI
jgi:hypothetical protein